MSRFQQADLQRFEQAIQTLRLYRKATLESDEGDPLIEQLYVDPLPANHVLSVATQPRTAFIIGRRGTGKSTIFQRAQYALRKEKRFLSTYIDIKTVYESAQVDPELMNRLPEADALPPAELRRLLLALSFVKAVVAGIKDDIQTQIRLTWQRRIREVITRRITGLLADLDHFVDDLDAGDFVNVQGIRTAKVSNSSSQELKSEEKLSAGISGPTPKIDLSANSGGSSSVTAKASVDFSELLIRVTDIRGLVDRLKAILEPLEIKHLIVFLDDFSELPHDAMQIVVDVLLAPLNNWSDELVKFKIAAYPGRIYYGDIDKTKIDEVSLDTHSLYGQANLTAMEGKAIDFTRRLVEQRFSHFNVTFSSFIEGKPDNNFWELLFYASMGNPRTLGYILYFVYEDRLLYDRPITVTSIRDASKRWYEEKVEHYFQIGQFLQVAFEERSAIFSLSDLLEKIVGKARQLRTYDGSNLARSLDGKVPTSHFHVTQNYDSLLSTLELNFFLTKYYVMVNRNGKRVSIYALNYGLCEKNSISFGRPRESRESRVWFIERIFDYGSIIDEWTASSEEIHCNTCGERFEHSQLAALELFKMRCPRCEIGTCSVIRASQSHAETLAAVADEDLLPKTELEILHVLRNAKRPMFAGDIAGELDVTPQLVGRRGKKLSDRSLVIRTTVRGRSQLEITDLALATYFAR
ncbi:hypothetical protein ACQP1P_40145 [Dactylosporangium sp. CA-052675]|uniref:hypothetical protein n=1 Tax=Dactylosporangium sp. CA-052675 TaxID=3239927 RepID=UPI003D8C92CC